MAHASRQDIDCTLRIEKIMLHDTVEVEQDLIEGQGGGLRTGDRSCFKTGNGSWVLKIMQKDKKRDRTIKGI
jgi:hypothetical protein